MFRVLRLQVLIFISLLGVGACKKFIPPNTSANYPFEKRIQSEAQGDITVSVGVPSQEETKQIFGADLYAVDVQPVWFKIQNQTQGSIALLLSSVDPEYYSPNEAAYKTRGVYTKDAQFLREKFFEDMELIPFVAPESEQSGFIFTHVDKGSKYFAADILTNHGFRRFTFVSTVPGLKIDYYEVDFDKLYPPNEIKEVTLNELRRNLEEFSCCTFSKKGELIGDPVNLVVVGHGQDALSAFIRAGWRETEIQKGQTWKTLASYLNRSRYDYAPMSTLWLYKRGQDAGFQKPRETPHERNHFRLWLTPWRFKGQEVWIGAISRDIGLRYTFKSPYMFITHKIDSDVDETREYFLEDLLAVDAVEMVGYVKGVGQVPIQEPKLNPMNDPWFSDGLRLVIFLSDKPVSSQDIKVLDWEFPPERDVGTIERLKEDDLSQ